VIGYECERNLGRVTKLNLVVGSLMDAVSFLSNG
jgi:hypothetical protein